MIRKTLSLASMLSTLLLVGLQATSHADTQQYVRTNCGISEDGVNAISVSMTVYNDIPTNPATPMTCSGSITMAGYTGNLNLALSATAEELDVSYETIN